MEEEGIELVLARATELRLKINNCVHKRATQLQAQQEPLAERLNGFNGDGAALGEDDEEEEEAQRLLNISDALESLVNQLSSLQVCLFLIAFIYYLGFLRMTPNYFEDFCLGFDCCKFCSIFFLFELGV